MAIKDMGASVLTRLKQQAKDTGLNYQMCLQLFCQEEFLRRLSLSKYSENMILKGGMFLYTLTEFESRPTRDIDFAMRRLSNDVGNIRDVMEEICLINTGNDFVTMNVLGTEQITPEKKYPGVKTKFQAHIKNVRIPFSIDIGVDDVIVPGAIKREICTRLPDFKKPEILTYSLESTIAEKFDAMIKRMDATSRMKDFYDIYYLSRMFDFEGMLLREAVEQTIVHRQTAHEKDTFEHIKQFADSEALLRLWENYAVTMGQALPPFKEVIHQIQIFLEPVYLSFVEDAEYTACWDSAKSAWD